MRPCLIVAATAATIKVAYAGMAAVDPTMYEFSTDVDAQRKQIMTRLATRAEGTATESERYARTQCLVTSASLLPTAPTPAAVKMRVFGFIDWSQAGSVVVAQVLD